jgi:hypothetical protein
MQMRNLIVALLALIIVLTGIAMIPDPNYGLTHAFIALITLVNHYRWTNFFYDRLFTANCRWSDGKTINRIEINSLSPILIYALSADVGESIVRSRLLTLSFIHSKAIVFISTFVGSNHLTSVVEFLAKTVDWSFIEIYSFSCIWGLFTHFKVY